MQKYFAMLLGLGCLSLTSCGAKMPAKSDRVVVEKSAESSLVDLDASTQIILALLHKNELTTILEDASPEQIDLMVKNFSPAEMAFEAEVLDKEIPVGVFFYQDAAQCKEIKAICDVLAPVYDTVIKFVAVPTNKLFKLTEKAEIDTFPAFLIIHQRNEVGVARREGNLSVSSIELAIKNAISSNA